MYPGTTRRILAVISLCLFMQTAAFTPWLHACCMDAGAGSAHGEHGGGHHTAPAGGTQVHAGAPRTEAPHAPAPAAGTGSAHLAHGHGDAHAPKAHPHGDSAGESDDPSESSGVCCCGACECCLSGAGVLVALPTMPRIAAGVARPSVPGRPADADVREPDFLLPFPNGPPETLVHLA